MSLLAVVATAEPQEPQRQQPENRSACCLHAATSFRRPAPEPPLHARDARHQQAPAPDRSGLVSGCLSARTSAQRRRDARHIHGGADNVSFFGRPGTRRCARLTAGYAALALFISHESESDERSPVGSRGCRRIRHADRRARSRRRRAALPRRRHRGAGRRRPLRAGLGAAGRRSLRARSRPGRVAAARHPQRRCARRRAGRRWRCSPRSGDWAS